MTSLQTSLTPADLRAYVARQVSTTYPDAVVDEARVAAAVDDALKRAGTAFAVGLRHTSIEAPRFDHRHTDQYATFLYFASHSAFLRGDVELASKLYGLNKALHATDLFYEVELPDTLLLQHPVGTVLGRARYGSFLAVYQRCSVGSSVDGAYPELGTGVVLYGGSAVIGSSRIGDNCLLSVGAIVMDQEVPSGHVVFGRSPDLVLRPTSRDVIREVFGVR